MHAERDFLRTVVEPELQERCRSRGLRLEFVDLLWGRQHEDHQAAGAESRSTLYRTVPALYRLFPMFEL